LYIKEVVLADENFNARLEKLKNETNVTLTVGTFTSVAVNWLPLIINGFKQIHPEVSFNIIDGGYGDIISAVERGVADIGFISTGNEIDDNTFPIYKDRILAVLPFEHKLASSDSVAVSCFASEPVISLSENTDFDSRRIFEKANIKPDIKYRTADDYAMISMVEHHLGICLMPPLFGVFADYVSVSVFPYFLLSMYAIMLVSMIIYDVQTAKYRKA
jgi:DNA-binding transcriptional LysR family regulator